MPANQVVGRCRSPDAVANQAPARHVDAVDSGARHGDGRGDGRQPVSRQQGVERRVTAGRFRRARERPTTGRSRAPVYPVASPETRQRDRCRARIARQEGRAFHLPAVRVVAGEVEPLGGGIDARVGGAGAYVGEHHRWLGDPGLRIHRRADDVGDARPVRRPDQVVAARAPRGSDVQGAVAREAVPDPSRHIHDNEVLKTAGPSRRRDPAAVGGYGRQSPVRIGRDCRDLADGAGVKVDLDEAARRGAPRNGDGPGSVRARGGGSEPGASGNPPHFAVRAGDVNVAHDSIPVHEILLGKDEAAVRQEGRSPDTVHARDGARWTASSRHADQPRVRTPVGAQIGDRPPVRRDGGIQAAACTARQGLRDCHRTVGGKVLRQALPRRLELLGPGLPCAGHRSERAPSRVVNRPPPGQLPGDLLDERAKRRPAVGPVDVVQERGAVDIRTASARPLRRSPCRLTRALEPALQGGGPQDHVVVRPV